METNKNTFIKLNLRGKKFLLNKEVHCKDPTSKISRVVTNKADCGTQAGTQVYLDRNPVLFPYILDYYSHGSIHYPQWVCADLVKDELTFWELEDSALSPCCWHRYHSELEDHETLRNVRTLLQDSDQPSVVTCKQHLHLFLTTPKYSTGAKVWSMFVLVLIVLSVFCFMLETLPVCREFIRPEYEQAFVNLTNRRNIYLLMHSKPKNPLVILELLTTLLLTVEFLMKLFSAPLKCKYMKHISAVSDFLGVFPVWILLILAMLRMNKHLNLEDSNPFKIIFLVFNYFRLFRLFRFVHVMTHIKGLMLFYLAIKASAKALGLLLILLLLYATVAANLIYLTEIHLDNFPSVFEGVWWAYITMTTVGYGDFYPVGTIGCIVGIFCAMTGILVIAMPVPVIVNNFSALYESSIKVHREQKYEKDQEKKAKDNSCKDNKVSPM